MTDKQKLIALLTEFGVEVKESTERGIAVVVCPYDGGKVLGYCDCFTEFRFDADGKFMQMGAWE